MLRSLIPLLIAAAVLVGGVDKDPKDGWKPTPIMRTVTPDEAKTGDTLTITGEFLDKERVSDVYLTTGEDNYKLEILSQTEAKLTAKIPASAKSGRLRLMVLTAGLEPQFLEQPLIVRLK